jgi:hypothetical protein
MRTNLVMTRGTERTFTLNLENADGDLPTLANATAELIVANAFTKTATIDESAGEATVTVEPVDTAGLSSWRFTVPYNVKLTEQDGTVLVPQAGWFTLVPDVED